MPAAAISMRINSVWSITSTIVSGINPTTMIRPNNTVSKAILTGVRCKKAAYSYRFFFHFIVLVHNNALLQLSPPYRVANAHHKRVAVAHGIGCREIPWPCVLIARPHQKTVAFKAVCAAIAYA